MHKAEEISWTPGVAPQTPSGSDIFWNRLMYKVYKEGL